MADANNNVNLPEWADAECSRDLPALRKKGEGQYLEYMQLTIKDTGCGIPAADLSKIQEPFFTTKRSGSLRSAGRDGVGRDSIHPSGQVQRDRDPRRYEPVSSPGGGGDAVQGAVVRSEIAP
jgi:hypothetical protein